MLRDEVVCPEKGRKAEEQNCVCHCGLGLSVEGLDKVVKVDGFIETVGGIQGFLSQCKEPSCVGDSTLWRVGRLDAVGKFVLEATEVDDLPLCGERGK